MTDDYAQVHFGEYFSLLRGIYPELNGLVVVFKQCLDFGSELWRLFSLSGKELLTI